MASANSDLTYKIGADTSDFQRKITGAKSAIRDFNTTSTNALRSLGDAFGVNTKQLETLGGAFKGLGVKMTSSANEGVQALGKLIASTSKLATGIAGLGLAAAVAGFKQLNAQAENFKQTLAGANMELQTQAYISTYKQAIADVNTENNRQLAELKQGFKEWWGRTTANIGQQATNALMGLLDKGNYSQDELAAQRNSALEKAERAKEIQQEIFNIQRQQAKNDVEVQSLTARIQEANERVAEASTTAEEKQRLMAQTAALTEQKYALMIPLQQRLAALITERNSLTASTVADENEELAAQKQINTLMADKAREMRKINTSQKSITAEVEKERAAAAEILASRKSLADWAASAGNVNAAIGSGAGAVTSAGMGLIPLKPVVDEQEWVDAAQMISMAVTSGTEAMSGAIGSLIGDLVTGGDAWGNFADNAVSAFGDMAIAIGKMAIATGIASKGIVESLKLYPELAIAAGAALVALGSAVKAGLSNISKGNYTSSANVASSSGAYGGMSSGGYATSTINVNVTGKLVAQGSTLAAVLSNEEKRKKTTT